MVVGPWGCTPGAVTGTGTDPTERKRVVVEFAPAEGSDWTEGAVRETAERILSRPGPEARPPARAFDLLPATALEADAATVMRLIPMPKVLAVRPPRPRDRNVRVGRHRRGVISEGKG